jgi:hypothetical protein
MSISDRPEFLTTRVSGNDGNAAGGLGLSSRLDFIQGFCQISEQLAESASSG